MKLTIKDTKGKDQGELEVKFPLVEDGKGTQAVHDAVVAYQAAQRMGTACTKNVGEVAGTNKKPWRQKGPAARARALSSRRCGAVVVWSSDPSPAISPRRFPAPPGSSRCAKRSASG